MQKFVIFVKKNFKTNMRKIKNIKKLEIITIIQGNTEVPRIACDMQLKNSVPKKFL